VIFHAPALQSRGIRGCDLVRVGGGAPADGTSSPLGPSKRDDIRELLGVQLCQRKKHSAGPCRGVAGFFHRQHLGKAPLVVQARSEPAALCSVCLSTAGRLATGDGGLECLKPGRQSWSRVPPTRPFDGVDKTPMDCGVCFHARTDSAAVIGDVEIRSGDRQILVSKNFAWCAAYVN